MPGGAKNNVTHLTEERSGRLSKNVQDYEVPRDLAFFLLHVSNISAKIYKRSIICHLNAAKSCIPLTWKRPQPPTIGLWLIRVEEINKTEDLVLMAQHKHERDPKTWTLWNMFVYSDRGGLFLMYRLLTKELLHGHPCWATAYVLFKTPPPFFPLFPF